MREADRVAAEVEEFQRRNRRHLVADDLRAWMLVSFSHRGERRVGKVKALGRRGATVITRSGSEFLVPFGGLRAAAWPGAVVTARCGDAEHTGIVKAVKGKRVTVRLTTPGYIGCGEDGLIWAYEVTAVRDDGKQQ